MRPYLRVINELCTRFQSTHSAGNATEKWGQDVTEKTYFNPRIPQGMRLLLLMVCPGQKKFQSTHSAGNATQDTRDRFITIPISIHAFRRECDVSRLKSFSSFTVFQSTHSAGNATRILTAGTPGMIFQSTHSAGNATLIRGAIMVSGSNFNPRIPQGMRRPGAINIPCLRRFQSTHSAGNATGAECPSERINKFQSTHSAGNATRSVKEGKGNSIISIHAFRRECDAHSGQFRPELAHFNPRIPQGMRR